MRMLGGEAVGCDAEDEKEKMEVVKKMNGVGMKWCRSQEDFKRRRALMRCIR